MPTSGSGFVQAYNVQAAVDTDSGLIVENHVTQATNDKQQIEPALEVLASREEVIGKPPALLADTGYFSQANVSAVDNFGAIPYIAEKRDAHNKPLLERFKPDDPMPEGDDVTALDLMRWRLSTKEGRAVYALRKSTIEPTFGIQKEVMGYRQFLVRGLEAVSAEWDLLCMCFNLKKMFSLMLKDLQNGLTFMLFSRAYRLLIASIWTLWHEQLVKSVRVRG